jgi:hypothetical protein
LIEVAEFLPGDHGQMRRVEPDHREERLLVFHGILHERQCPVEDDPRIVAFQVFRRELVLAHPVMRAILSHIERVFDGNPTIVQALSLAKRLGLPHGIPGGHFGFGREILIEPVHAGRGVMLGLARFAAVGIFDLGGQCAQMPFAEMPRGVAFGLKGLGQGEFLGVHVAGIGGGNAIPKRMPARVHAAPRGRAHRRLRVKPRELQTRFGHRIQMRRLGNGRPVKPHITPA